MKLAKVLMVSLKSNTDIESIDFVMMITLIGVWIFNKVKWEIICKALR